METILIDELDREGKTIARWPETELKKRMFMHAVSVILPKTAEDEFILARRAATKHPYPDTWMCAIGGKVHADETPQQAALREMQEEGNTQRDLVFLGTYIHDDQTYKGRFFIYTTVRPMIVSEFDVDQREIAYLKAFSMPTLKEMIAKHPSDFAPTFLGILQTIAREH